MAARPVSRACEPTAYSRVLKRHSRRTHGYSRRTHGVLTGPHAQVLEQYYASVQRLGAQLDAALLKRREAERLLAAEACARIYICLWACVRACVCA